MRRDFAALSAAEFDVAVVGGGICGAAAAWDAAQRGLRVALVERADFGGATSWNSLKTIHGGVRHLQAAAFGKVRESARERRTLLTIAPALVRPLPVVVPAYGHGPVGREALAVAMRLYDWLTPDPTDGWPEGARTQASRTVSAAEARRVLPGLDSRGLTGAALWSDAQAWSTERLTLGFVHAAADAGALPVNYADAVELLRADGRVAGVAVRDVTAERTVEVRARMVLNAAGPWVDELLGRGGPPGKGAPLLRARNLVLDLPPPVPFGVGARSGGRFLFLVPWRDRTLVGTSYEPASGPPSDPLEFQAEAARAFPWAAVASAAICLVHEGLVPGRGPSDLASDPRLHDHEVEDGLGGLVTMQGVKYTTARALAERAIDVVARRLGREPRASRTASTPLARVRPLEGDLATRTRAAVRDEMALGLGDAVLRRLDLGTAGRPAPEDLDAVCRVLREELGWDEAREESERAELVRRYPS